MHIKQINTDKDELNQVRSLLNKVFNREWGLDYLEWLYSENPDGKVVGFNAFDEDRLVAHYATIPFKAIVYGKEELGLLSLNTATHPEYKGKGLFTQLAKETYSYAKHHGFTFVVGVANNNSTPGFLKHLGFEKICSLNAMLGLGKTKFRDEFSSGFLPIRNKAKTNWRLSNPESNYFNYASYTYSKTDKSFINAQICDTANSSHVDGKKGITLLLGTKAHLEHKEGFFLPIPSVLKPSPLNLIYLDLTRKGRTFNEKNVDFGLFDFDAY